MYDPIQLGAVDQATNSVGRTHLLPSELYRNSRERSLCLRHQRTPLRLDPAGSVNDGFYHPLDIVVTLSCVLIWNSTSDSIGHQEYIHLDLSVIFLQRRCKSECVVGLFGSVWSVINQNENVHWVSLECLLED